MAGTCVDCGRSISVEQGDCACVSGPIVGPCGAWTETHVEQWTAGMQDRGQVDCGCGWGDLCDAPRDTDAWEAPMMSTYTANHWHVATGLSGYGPDGADGFASFDSLAQALDYARDEMRDAIDFAHDGAHGFAQAEDYESAWNEVLRIESLETLRANLDPARQSAPLYRDDPVAYAALLESQAADFPHDWSEHTRLYLWQCEDPATCEHGEEL